MCLQLVEDTSDRQTSRTGVFGPLQLIGPELTGVVVRWRVGDVLHHKVGDGQLLQHLLRPVRVGSVDNLQDREDTLRTH